MNMSISVLNSVVGQARLGGVERWKQAASAAGELSGCVSRGVRNKPDFKGGND